MRFSIAVVTMMAFGGLAAAQHQHSTTPYTGLEQRAIKALSEQQISDLRAGRGMGLAFLSCAFAKVVNVCRANPQWNQRRVY